MATYPTGLIQLEGSAVLSFDGKQTRQTVSGKFRIRSSFSAVRKTVTLKHYLTSAEVATLDAFYLANADVAFTLVYQANGTSYSCYFTGHPQYVPMSGGYYGVTVQAVVA